MNVILVRSNLCSLTLFAWLLCETGCVSPTFHGRCHVEKNISTATWHDLGPKMLQCDISIPELVQWEDGLDEEEAIAVGLWNNPGYQELLADLDITRADVIEAAQLQNPQITTLLPVGPKQWEFTLNLPLDVLWLRPIRVAAAQLEAARVVERLSQDGLNVVRDVRLAWIDWQLAIQRADLAEYGKSLRSEIARISEARLKAGEIAELDSSASRLDALFGQAELMRAERDVELAYERLRYLLGLQLSDLVITAASMSEPSVELPSSEDLVAEAILRRPDLRAVRFAISAATQRTEFARRGIWQLAGLLPDINSRGRKGFEAGPGLQFTLPIFHKNDGAVARNAAEVDRLRRQYVNLRDTAALEVRQSYTRILQAQQDLQIWREQVLPLAQAAVQSAQQALKEDAVSLLLVLETTRQLLGAQQRALESGAQLRREIANLERSVGRRLFDTVTSADEDEGLLPAPGAGAH